jgi:hypothetical protein
MVFQYETLPQPIDLNGNPMKQGKIVMYAPSSNEDSRIIFRVLIDSNGFVECHENISSGNADPGYILSAGKQLESTHFIPAKQNGRPVAGVFVFSVFIEKENEDHTKHTKN